MSVLRCVLVGVVALLAAGGVGAQPDGEPTGSRSEPWAVNVTDADRQAALAIFDEAKALYSEGQFGPALLKYGQALARWDHPLIHFSMGMCLIRMEQDPLGALEHFEKSVAYGEGPISAEQLERATTFVSLLRNQVATIVVRSAFAVPVSIDGAIVLDKSGEISRRVRPGPHQVVASKEGYETFTARIVAVAGETHSVAVHLVRPARSVTRSQTRFPVWVPWTTLGTGAVVALGVGLPFHISSQSKFDEFDDGLRAQCGAGCSEGDSESAVPALPEGLAATRDTAESRRVAAIAAYSIGGALLVAGGALLVLNRPTEVTEVIRVAPSVGPDGAGASLAIDF